MCGFSSLESRVHNICNRGSNKRCVLFHLLLAYTFCLLILSAFYIDTNYFSVLFIMLRIISEMLSLLCCSFLTLLLCSFVSVFLCLFVPLFLCSFVPCNIISEMLSAKLRSVCRQFSVVADSFSFYQIVTFRLRLHCLFSNSVFFLISTLTVFLTLTFLFDLSPLC